MFKKLFTICFIVLMLLVITAVFLSKENQAAERSPDAIGLRVIPNPGYYSSLVWYKKNIKLQGSPQNLTVDGYGAVRDGRTVYVNAANISGNNFYTNIYIISYNQDAEAGTIDIFGQILAHWKFNANIIQSGSCSKTTNKDCVQSADCPQGEYCAGPKAKIIRDTKRLEDLAEIKIALENYKKNHNNRYPQLAAGSYLPNKTISVWPSWRATLGAELGITMPLDPVNKLGACPGYDVETCWDQKNKEFNGTIPSGLPSGSYVYAYSVAADGSHYDSCGYMESGHVREEQNSACPGSRGSGGLSHQVSGDIGNHNPVISNNVGGVSSIVENGYTIIKAVSGQPLKFFVSGSDQDQDDLSSLSLWQIVAIDPAARDDWLAAQWSGYPQLQSTQVSNIKKIFATTVGQTGPCSNDVCQTKDYVFHLELSDGRGGIATAKYKIRVSWGCRGLLASDINLNEGAGDGVVYDNAANWNTANNMPNGAYLKLGSIMPTPYIWIANSNINKVSKIRTYDGYKRMCDRSGSLVNCYWDKSVWETRGQLIGVFSVGNNPSRTAVNVETGDVWIANRDSGDIHKLDINGNVLKRCATGSGPRGLAIQKNGDVWVANYGNGNVVKLSGDDASCTVLATANTGGNPYGLAVDSDDNIWVANRGSGLIQKINTATHEVTNYSAGGGNCGDAGYFPYGITVDLNDNVWVADTCHGVYKFTQSTGVVTHHTFAGLANGSGRSRGVTIDTAGSIWIAFDYSNQVVKIPDPANPASYSIFNTSSSFPIGIAGDSLGGVWSVGYSSGKVDLFNSLGLVLGSYDVSNLSGVQPYTYSDMTGLNRSMILRAGYWTSEVFDSGHNNQHWGKIKWAEIIPGEKQEAKIYIRASDGDINSESWKTAADWNSLKLIDKKGQYLQIKVELKSRERVKTSVVSALNLDCD